MSKVWTWAALPIVLIAGFVVANGLDPYVTFDMPVQILAVNAVLPLAVLFLVWGLSGRAWVGLLVEVLLVAALRYAGQMKLTLLNTDLVYADFTVLGGLLKDPHLVLGFVRPGWVLWAGMLGLVLVIALLVWLSRRSRPLAWRWRLACVGVAVAVAAFAGTYRAPPVMHALNWEVFQQALGAHRVGVSGNLLLGAMTGGDVDRPADPAMVQAFWREPVVRSLQRTLEARPAGGRPDVVVVQSESLFMPSQLCGFSDTPVLKRITSGDTGFLRVPVFGGRTLQTEFEVQSGAPIAFFPGSMFAYYELLHQRVDAWPHRMDALGYRTLVIHPNVRGFWNRDAAMPQLGFATYQDDGSFLWGDYADHGHISDLALSRAILSELDAANRPTYLTAITMDNHGPWGDHAPKDDSDLGLPANLHGEARLQMADYIARVRDADAAFGYLIDGLQRRGRPTIVVLYGDHLPALAPVYQQLCFKDGQPPHKHMPPYRLWSNFKIDPPPPELPAYLLQGYIMRQAGLPLSGHLLANAIAGMVSVDKQLAPADRKRILGEYAHVAAANLQRKAGAPDPQRGAVFVGSHGALAALQRIAPPRVTAGSKELRDGDLYLLPDANGAGAVEFRLDRRVASLSLRPYMLCKGTATVDPVATLHADGRLLYRAPIGPDLLRLLTFDLHGAEQLTFAVTGLTGKACGAYLRVAQAMRCAGTCPLPDGGTQLAPSRIVAHDPTAGDRLALAATQSPEQKRRVDRTSSLQWLLAHEVARQQGLAPISEQPDAQLFMHPADNRDAWIEFDVSRLDALDLTPRINALDAHCQSLAKGGVVALNVFADNRRVVDALRIDRDYDAPLHIDLKGARRLRIDVNRGNDVSWCDWFSVGAERLRMRAAPQVEATTVED